MFERKEKLVMSYLCKVCSGRKTSLISPSQIAEAISKRCVLSVAELDEVMAQLALENYIDFVVSDGRDGYFYCVTLKKKGQTYLIDTRKQRKTLGLLVLRSMLLATVSFVFGLLLKAIFKG